MKKWEKLSSQSLFKDQWIHVLSNSYKHNGEIVAPWYVLDYPDWVNVLAITLHKQLVIIRQYRPGPDQFLWELPAGGVTEGETPEEAAKRELLEETGHTSEKLLPIGVQYVNPSNHNNKLHSFLALEAIKIRAPELEKNEVIETELMSCSQVDALVSQNQFQVASQLSCYLLAKMKFPQHF